jgi:hypothetical protein
MIKKCWAPWASKAAPAAVGVLTKQVNGQGQAEMSKALAEGLIDQVQDLPAISGSIHAAILKAATPFDYVHAELHVTGAGPFAPIPVPDAGELGRLGICELPCRISGRLTFHHPAWGRVALVTTEAVDADPVEKEGNIAVFDQAGTARWKHRASWMQLGLATPPTDATGHLFLNYNPGRYDGVVILSPTTAGFDDYGSLPQPPDDQTGGFYSGAAVDLDKDGTYEIKVDANTCEPDCAAANYLEMLYRWTGNSYEKYSSRRLPQ